MRRILDAPVYVHGAAGAAKALDRRRRIDDLELLGVRRDLELAALDDRHDREPRVRRLLALGAAAGVIEGGV